MKLLDAIREQVSFELESAYIYRTMAAWLENNDLPGFAHWMDIQTKEEIIHAEKFIQLLRDMGELVTFRPIDPGNGEFDSVLDVFQKALDHEKLVTSKIHNLVDINEEEKDRRVDSTLVWFVDEQVEEEANFSHLVAVLERAGENWGAIYQLDAAMAQRPEPTPANADQAN